MDDAVHVRSNICNIPRSCCISREFLLQINVEPNIPHHDMRLQHKFEVAQLARNLLETVFLVKLCRSS